MKIATIDIGSNTVLMLISEFEPESAVLKTIVNRYKIPRLSKNLESKQIITDESRRKLIKVLRDYAELAYSFNCERIIAFATNALRIAKNSIEIIEEVKRETDINIKVIPGSEEARLSYLSAVNSSDSNENIVIDIGGGSTEVIYGKSGKIKFKKSFKIGAVNLTERFIKNFPVENSLIREIKNEINIEFSELNGINWKQMRLIAVAGTPTSIAAMRQGLDYYDEMKIENYRIKVNELAEFTEKIKSVTPEKLLEKYPNLLKGRADVLFAGSMLLLEITRILQGSEIFVSGRGLRYGMALDLFRGYFNIPLDKRIEIK